MADVCLRLQKSASPLALNDNYFTHVYFGILEPFLQILIDSLIGYLADQGKIRNTHFLLFSTFEYRFPDLRLASTARSFGIPRLANGVSLLLAAGSLCDRLLQSQYLEPKGKRRMSQGAYHCDQSRITPKMLSISQAAYVLFLRRLAGQGGRAEC